MGLETKFLHLDELNELKKFVYNNWNKKHIFLKSDKLIKWQHCSLGNRLDFFISKEKSKIVSLLGIINQSRDSKYSEISLAIWISKKKSAGAKLFLTLEKKFNFNLIKGTTVNEKIIPMYKLLGFHVNKFNIYYLTNLPNIKQKLSYNLYPSKLFNLSKLKKIDFDKIYKKKNVNSKYLDWRFNKHPIYKYNLITDNKMSLVLIYRVIKIDNLKIMRVVEFIGTFKKKNDFIKKLNFFLYENNFQYLEFFHYGFEDKYIKESGLKKLNVNQKIAMYTEPFNGLMYKDFYCCYKTSKKNKIKIVRADGDFDRPSVIP